MSVNLHELLPNVYQGIIETDAVMTTEESLINNFITSMTTGLDNTFISTADEDSVTRYETLIGITADPSETLEFRRQRLINRFSMNPPFSLRFLQQRLDEIIGVDKWETYMDTTNYTLYIYSSAENQDWFNEIRITVNKIKPANIIFINSPRITEGIDMSEVVKYQTTTYNYRLGVSWNLGVNPFASLSDEEVIKLATTPSIQNKLLNNIAISTASDIAKVRINNSYVITTFTTKSATNNVVTVEYAVPISSGLTTVTQIELLDSNNNVLTNCPVYIPLLQDIQMQHKLTTVEGV